MVEDCKMYHVLAQLPKDTWNAVRGLQSCRHAYSGHQTAVTVAWQTGRKVPTTASRDFKANGSTADFAELGSPHNYLICDITLDGPFDQLPDNFIKGDLLLEAILDARPDLKGSIDRYGNFAVGDQRYLVSLYLHYSTPNDLLPLEHCIEKSSPESVENCIANVMSLP